MSESNGASNLPYMIDFPSKGALEIGYIAISENTNLPFVPKRTFWAYHTPDSVVRGRHAHYETEMILVAVSGYVTVTTEDLDGNIQTFKLDSPKKGLFIPKMNWHTMTYSHNAVQVVFASTEYKESDYIRDYDIFRSKNKF